MYLVFTIDEGLINMIRLSDPELAIMKVMWDAGEPVRRKYLQEQLSYFGWKPHTFNTYLTRMQEKGVIAFEGETKGKTFLYRPLITREKYSEQIGTNLLNQLFSGSIKNFVATMSNMDAINPADLQELKAYLEQMKEADRGD